MTQKELYLTWLNTFYAYQKSLAETYEKRAGGAEYLPEIETELKRHAQQKQKHMELLKACIERNGGDLSSVKSTLGGMVGTLDTVLTKPLSGEVIYNVLIDYTSETTAIGACESLIATAKELGDMESIHTYKTILQAEEEMADYLRKSIPSVTQKTLQHETENQ